MNTNKKRTGTKVFRSAPLLITALTLISTMLPGTVSAAGLLIADGGFGGVLEIKEHQVHVTINNGVAVTQVTQVFHNTENRQVEALYTFPVPKSASVDNFCLWIKGKEMVGEVLEKKKAREIYDSYKKRRRDPGLLEQKDYKTFEMRIYPINAGADQKVQITYYQELDVDHNEATYVYPLATVTKPGIDARVSGRFGITVEVKSAIPLSGIGSPSHGDDFVIARHAENYHLASLEAAEGSLARDVVVGYALARPKTGIDLITSRQDREDGFFCMSITVGEELAKLDEGMDYVFVLDVSGSMATDGKLLVSKDAVLAFIDALGDDDRFDVMTFNVSPDTLFGELRPAGEAAKQEVSAYLDSQRARGGTALVPAMTTAYKYGNPDRPLNVIILSDGITEQQERQTLMQLIQSRPRFARVFCIGIGNEVNRPLLEQMAGDSGGLAAFVSRGDDFQRQAQAFRRKLTRPAASDLTMEVSGVRVYDVEPRVLPNLYYGSPIRIYGRYAGDGEATVTLKGNVRGIALAQSATMQFPRQDGGNPEIERMWAWKRIDGLLKQADRSGDRNAVADEVIRLGEAYSIVSEYTSFLVLENDAEYQRWKIERRNADRVERDRRAQVARREQLEAIRNKAVADLGPQPVVNNQAGGETRPQVQQAASRQTPQPATQPSTTNADPRQRQSRDFDFGGGGSGPVGPLFVAAAYWMRRRKSKTDSRKEKI